MFSSLDNRSSREKRDKTTERIQGYFPIATLGYEFAIASVRPKIGVMVLDPVQFLPTAKELLRLLSSQQMNLLGNSMEREYRHHQVQTNRLIKDRVCRSVASIATELTNQLFDS